VLQYSGMMLPDTDRRRKQMDTYNKDIMEPLADIQNETVRARKRMLKEDYKRCMKKHTHMAKYVNTTSHLEDFFFLQGHSKQGAPLSSKK